MTTPSTPQPSPFLAALAALVEAAEEVYSTFPHGGEAHGYPEHLPCWGDHLCELQAWLSEERAVRVAVGGLPVGLDALLREEEADGVSATEILGALERARADYKADRRFRAPEGFTDAQRRIYGATYADRIAESNALFAMDAYHETDAWRIEATAYTIVAEAFGSYRQNTRDTVREYGGGDVEVAHAMAAFDGYVMQHTGAFVALVEAAIAEREADEDEPLCDSCGSTDGDVRDYRSTEGAPVALCGACGGHGEPHEPAGEDKARAYLAETQGVDVLDDGTPVEAYPDRCADRVYNRAVGSLLFALGPDLDEVDVPKAVRMRLRTALRDFAQATRQTAEAHAVSDD